MEWFVYILRCGDGTLYTGVTNDMSRRLGEHNAGTGARYTRSRLPVKLLYEERHRNRSSATRREAEIKKMERCEKISLTLAVKRSAIS